MNKTCLICNKQFNKKKYESVKSFFEKRKTCSKECKKLWISRVNKVIKLSPPIWPKGKKKPPRSEEHKKKLSLFRKGKTYEELYGKDKEQELKKKVSIQMTGKKYALGYRFTKEQRLNKSMHMPKGKIHYRWKGGITKQNELIRKSLQYRVWREQIFNRDNYTCQLCNRRGGVLHADHIKPFSLYPKLRFEIQNGRTLCIDCHKETDTFGYKAYQLKQENVYA